MKLWIVSDLHVNHLPWVPNCVPEHDVLVVAGDVSDNGGRTLRELHALHRRTGKPVIFVPGNHDAFDGPLEGFSPQLKGAVHVLPAGQHALIDGVRFIGATLWSDFLLFDTEFASQAWAARHMPEYQHVWRHDGSKLWPIDTAAAHDRHRARIATELMQSFEGPTVVVTHHAPSAKSITGGIDAASAAFASDLEDLIERHRPALWVHGHIHAASDYRIGGTRIVCNPRGYEGHDWYENSGWNEDLVVTV